MSNPVKVQLICALEAKKGTFEMNLYSFLYCFLSVNMSTFIFAVWKILETVPKWDTAPVF